MTISVTESYIGLKVEKISKKPFKSTYKINTIKGYFIHPVLNILCFIFEEDSSYVECRRCELI